MKSEVNNKEKLTSNSLSDCFCSFEFSLKMLFYIIILFPDETSHTSTLKPNMFGYSIQYLARKTIKDGFSHSYFLCATVKADTGAAIENFPWFLLFTLTIPLSYNLPLTLGRCFLINRGRTNSYKTLQKPYKKPLWYFNKNSKNLPLLYCCCCLEALRSLSCVNQHLSLFVYTADIYIQLIVQEKKNRQFQRSIYLTCFRYVLYTWCFSLLLTVSFQEW